MTIKIARNHYGRFEHPILGLSLSRDDTFVVTPEIEESKAFKTGLERKKFEILDITNITDVQNAHGATDEMVEAVRESLTAEPEEPEPEAVPEVTEDAPVDEEATPEPPAEAVVDSTSSDVGTDGDAVITPPAPPEEEPPIAFTEEANSWQAAVMLVKEETDTEKLRFALREDERKSVKRAIVARLKELEG